MAVQPPRSAGTGFPGRNALADGRPIYYSAPVSPGILYGSVYGVAYGIIAGVIVGLPITCAAACLGKALEIGVVLRFP